MTSGGLVVAWEGAVKRVLSRRKLYGNQIYEMFRASGSAEKVTNLSHRSHQIGTFGGFSWRMKKFVSFRIVALAFIASFVTQVTCAYASVSFLGVAAGDATTDEVTVWTRAKDEVSPGPTAINVQISRDPNFIWGVTTLPAGTADAPSDYTVKTNIGSLRSATFIITDFRLSTLLW